jgi:hypothetical protein
MIEVALLDRDDLSTSEKLLYVYLRRYRNHESGTAFPGYARLQQHFSHDGKPCMTSSLWRWLRSLHTAGLLAWENHGRGLCYYFPDTPGFPAVFQAMPLSRAPLPSRPESLHYADSDRAKEGGQSLHYADSDCAKGEEQSLHYADSESSLEVPTKYMNSTRGDPPSGGPASPAVPHAHASLASLAHSALDGTLLPPAAVERVAMTADVPHRNAAPAARKATRTVGERLASETPDVAPVKQAAKLLPPTAEAYALLEHWLACGGVTPQGGQVTRYLRYRYAATHCTTLLWEVQGDVREAKEYITWRCGKGESNKLPYYAADYRMHPRFRSQRIDHARSRATTPAHSSAHAAPACADLSILDATERAFAASYFAALDAGDPNGGKLPPLPWERADQDG